jgi:tRNA(adenine34) deaminase
MLKNPSSLSFRGAAGNEESRKSVVSRARFLPFAPLWVGMTTSANVLQHSVGTFSTADANFMRRALREAQKADAEGEVPVGAVVVRDEKIIARAHNRPLGLSDPSAHAEVLALRRAAKKLGNYRLKGCDLYVTIEPCAMCAGAIIQARLRRVVYGTPDPKAGACGSALAVLNHPKVNHQVEVVSGVLAEECASILQEFFRCRRRRT